MTIPTPQYAALDGILRRAKHLILDFDGPVCSLYHRQPPGQAADQLRAVLAEHRVPIPEPIATTVDPFAVLVHAATISPDLGRQAEAQLTRCELSAVPTAQAAGYIHDVASSAREGNRTVTVISTYSADTVRAYIDRASLNELIGVVIGRIGSALDAIAEPDLIGRALAALSVDPADCIFVTASRILLDCASRHRVATIAYARTLADRTSLSAHADITVADLADIVPGLRSHPLTS